MMIKIGKSVKSLELRPFTNECSYRIAEADEDRDLLKGQTDKKRKKKIIVMPTMRFRRSVVY